MTWIDRLLRRDRLYEDLSEEIRAHLDEKADELVARGMSRRDARLEARRAFGNVTGIEERARDTWQWPRLESFVMDVRYALRQLRHAPGLSAIIVLTLAIGIGATSTVFSWTRGVLLDPLPGVAEPSRVLALETTSASGSWTPTSWLDYVDFRKYLTSFDGLAATFPTWIAVGESQHAERHPAELVSANFFDVLGVRPAVGRLVETSQGDAPGTRPNVVISYDYWQSHWRGEPSAVGGVIEINGYPFSIIGVAPRDFHGSMPAERVDAWVPASMLGAIVPTGGWWLRDRGTRTFRVLARLRPGVTVAAARQEVEAFTIRMAAANGGQSRGMRGLLLPLWQSHWGAQNGLRAPLLVLFAACLLVLLTVCVNAAGLLLARAIGRRRELGLRLALGAQRRRLLRQLLTETSVLVASGAALGLLATVWLARTLHMLVPRFALPSLLDPRVDATVVLFVVCVAAAVTLAAGVAPAVHGSREDYRESLEGGRGGVGGVRGARLRSTLVVAEMALAVVSLAIAGLFFDSVRHTRALSPGFDADHVAMATVSLTLAGYDSSRGQNFLRDVAERLRREPGTSAVSYADYVPLSLSPGSWEDLRIDGYAAQPNENMKLARSVVGPGYFATMGLPLVAGRDFNLGDDSAHARVMIVNQAFVHHFLGDKAALGVRVHGWGYWFTIVGVAADSKTYRLTDPPAPYFYVPVRQVYRPEYGYTFLVRSAMPVDRTVRAISQAVRAADPSVPVFNAMPLADYVSVPLQSQETAARMLALLACIASLLAAVGLYGIVSYTVAQRTKEIGMRIALGARTRDVLRLVGGQTGVMLVAGLAGGLAGGAAIARVLASMLSLSGGDDAAVFGAAAVVMGLIALAATGLPARRASRVDPVIALRTD